jgi:superfamily II DNA or RNA helicase
MEQLLDYQKPHVETLMKILNKHNRALDASDTGTGKTYSAVALCKELKLKPLIICPKSVIPDWLEVLTIFNVANYGIANYELIKNCRFYKNKETRPSPCPYIKRLKGNQIMTNVQKNTKKNKIKWLFSWNFPKDCILIFDEAHRCKNKKTSTSDLLFTASHHDIKILMLSATACDKPENFATAGYVLNLYDSLSKGIEWINKVGSGYFNIMEGVHHALFTEYASRMKIADLGDLFPVNIIKAKCYDMDCSKELQEQYDLIKEAIEQLQNQEDKTEGLGKLIKARMRIEMLKVPTFIDKINKQLQKNKSVTVFVNFTQTLLKLAQELKTNCMIHGQQTLEQRSANIKAFNTNESKIILCNIRAGGVGISLHDKIGGFLRTSVISPSWSAQDIIQVLGRVHRANGKSECLQKIIFCKNTVEESVCETMIEKIKNIAALNDGKLDSYKIKGLMDPNVVEETPDLQKAITQLNALYTKKGRLTAEMEEVDDMIKTMTLTIELLSNNDDQNLIYYSDDPTSNNSDTPTNHNTLHSLMYS